MITEVMMGVVPDPIPAPELTPAQIRFLESSIKGFDAADWKVELAGQAASMRRFFRVTRPESSTAASKSALESEPLPQTYILVEWDSRDEDWPRFLDIEAHVSASVDFLPKIYANDPVHGLILEEDLGVATLKNFGVVYSYNSDLIKDVYRDVIDALCCWQRLDVAGCSAIASRALDAEVFLWESAYFAQHCVTGYFGKEGMLTGAWEKERRRMAESAAGIPRVCIHRDFQSENILIEGGQIRFVDYQGARMGPPHYDLASLLLDPYVNLGYEIVDELVDYYLDKTGAAGDRHNFYLCAAQRLMQALGAYGNLSLHKGKPHYRQFIPAAVERLSYVLKFLPNYQAMNEIADTLRP